MITLNYSGWSKGYGSFSFDIPFDDSRTNWKICFPSGKVYRQSTPFQEEARDWNCDGYVRAEYGAWFYCDESSRGEFFAPQTMLRLVIDGEAIIPGLISTDAPIKKYLDEKECENDTPSF